ncbi:MAG: diadenylate cyclase CdaA [Caldilinea sp.]|nr:diadenylate cyclase CdaA [Caldilinea sp.]MDW8439596.1 diadenylate cyclase CdaA [Caldilineaceae bacterium]
MTDVFASLSRLSSWQSLLDVALVTLIFYGLFRLFRGTRAVQLVRGVLLFIIIFAVLGQTIDLPAFNWLMRTTAPMVLFAIPVIFQPELRRALERIGRSAPLWMRRGDTSEVQSLIAEFVKSVEWLSQRRHGALIVFEGVTGLAEIVDSGVLLDAEVSSELLNTIFYPNTPLHDGAVVVRRNRLLAASCVLPLTDRELADTQMGTRHRAAIGVTEQSDALVIVVSEETGRISVARNGRIVRVDSNRLRSILSDYYSNTLAD